MRIGICAIASPLEIPYLREWFEHHQAMGVNEFILFLNDWTPVDMVVFNKLFWKEMNEGIVKAHRLDGVAMQMPAYNAGTIMANQQNLDWCAFIDIDEFLTIRSDRTLEDILSDFSDIPSLVLRWRLFSSGGQETVPVVNGRKNFSVKRFTKCCPRLEELTK